jgi:hypothetical protein
MDGTVAGLTQLSSFQPGLTAAGIPRAGASSRFTDENQAILERLAR